MDTLSLTIIETDPCCERHHIIDCLEWQRQTTAHDWPLSKADGQLLAAGG